jgi:heterodisulfide reductase subunit C
MTKPKGSTQPPKPVDIPGALMALREMASKPKLTPFAELLQEGEDLILKALEQGYSYTDISRKLREYEIRVSSGALKEQVEPMRSQDLIQIEIPEPTVVQSPKTTPTQSPETTRSNGHH